MEGQFQLDTRMQQQTKWAILGILRPQHTAHVEDVMQQAHLAAIEHKEQFKGDSCYRTWFHRIAVNKALEHRRLKANSAFVSGGELEQELEGLSLFLNQPDSSPNPEERLLAKERKRLLLKAILGLPPTLRATTLLYLVKGHEGYEGQRLNNAQKARLFRAIRQLRKALLCQ